VSPRCLDIEKGTPKSNGHPDIDLRSAIWVYLVAKRRDGATIGEIALLTFGGGPPIEEVVPISRAVSELEQQGEVTMKGGKVCPIVTD
jgi:hypothetical protein